VASGLVVLATILMIAGLALPVAHMAHASEVVNGAPCVVPENAAEIEETYRIKSDAALTGWELESVDVGCGGSIYATYILPEFSDGDTTFRVSLEPPREDPFPEDFIEQREASVAQSVSDIMSNPVFKAVDAEFANKTISFSYGTGSYFYISAYEGFENCKSSFEVDGLHPELLSFTVSNDADLDIIPLIKTARGHANEQLQNASAGAIMIRNASDSACGQTHVNTSYMIDNRGIEPYSYSAYIDLECDATIRDGECPGQIQLVYGTTFQSPIVSSLLNSTAPDNDDDSQPRPSNQEKEIGETDAWFYNMIVPVGIGSAVAGVAAFVMLRKL
jgi:hypothetical protein